MLEKKDMKKYFVLIAFAIISYFLINNLQEVVLVLKGLLSVLSPFIIGCCLAFILNIPMNKIEFFLKKSLRKNSKVPIRTVSIFLSFLILIIVVCFVAFLLIPELIENIQVLISNIPVFIKEIEVFIVDMLDKYPEVQIKIQEAFKTDANAGELISNLLNYIISGAISFVSKLVSGVITIFTSLIFAIYVLSQKEYLKCGSKKVLYAYLNKDKTNKILEVADLANKTFSKFISGQCVEAIILGCIFFVVLTICGFPYALLISVLTTITALIPIFGAMIAMGIGAVLIFINNPLQALLFIIVFQIIQQIEGNFIYPRIVGASVGLSPMWTLLSISVGGSLYGMVGMLVALPIASVFYALIKSDVNKKLVKKKINI